MLKKGSRLYSILKMKCPQCHEGDFFISHPYDLKKAGELHETCSVCHIKYSKEPGFYYGAMYVSYALTVALFVTMWTSFNLFFDNVSVGLQIFLIITATILLTPYLYALSKIIWANFFIKYDRERKSNSIN
ncbi:MAG TPA: DUF983 domain-containing protein [Crocinitomicaceae bacterium]|nr:DUF983 domain-containing protein [Crocinitomicaceae bacterium]